MSGFPKRGAGPAQIKVVDRNPTALHKTRRNGAQEEGVCSVLAHQFNLVVLSENKVSEGGLQNLLQVFLRSFPCHIDPDVRRHPKKGVVNVSHGSLSGSSGQLAAQAADAAQEVLQSRLACANKDGVVSGLTWLIALLQCLSICVAAGRRAKGCRADGGSQRGGACPRRHGGEEDGRGHIGCGGHKVVGGLPHAAAKERWAGVRQIFPDFCRAKLTGRGGQPLLGEHLPDAAAKLFNSCACGIGSGGAGTKEGGVNASDRVGPLPALPCVQCLLQVIQITLGGVLTLLCQQVVVDIHLILGHEVVERPAHRLVPFQLIFQNFLIVLPGVGDNVPYVLCARPPAEYIRKPLRLRDGWVFNGSALGGILGEVALVPISGISLPDL